METFIGDNLDSIVEKILSNKQIEVADKWIVAFLMSMLWIRGQEMRKQIHRIEKETRPVIWPRSMSFIMRLPVCPARSYTSFTCQPLLLA
jgi:hypothetical protein